jgi:hypothetical protein
MRQWGEPSAPYRIRQTSTEGKRLLGTLAREIAAVVICIQRRFRRWALDDVCRLSERSCAELS